jgi:NADH-quinone oxidoreductase subunit J
MIVLTRNPIFSVLFLILAFCNFAVLLVLIGLEFLPIVFLVVYVGAIAVLFLFVLMMLNIKIAEIQSKNYSSSLVYSLISLAVLFEFIWLLYFQFNHIDTSIKAHSNLLLENIEIITSLLNFDIYLKYSSNVSSIGSLLFSRFFLPFITVGFVLLLAMIGAITLSLTKRFTAYSQNIYLQVLRDHNEVIRKYS